MRKSHLLRSGNTWKLVTAAAVSPLFLAAADASGQLAISIAIRENGSTAPIGADGGNTGFGLEWVNLDGQTLTLDGTWQQFTFNFQSDPLTAFAGTTANGQYDGTRGVLESIRIRNQGAGTDPITLWIDDVVNTISGTPNVISGFEESDPFPAFVGTEHIFQEPSFSGSTVGVVVGSDSSLVTDQVARTGTQSTEVKFTWASDSTGNLIRLTSFSAGNLQPNPTIDFADGSQLTFWIRGLAAPPENFWTGAAGNGNWNDPGNWATGTVPNSTTAVANFLTDATSPTTVSLAEPTTVSTIRLNNANTFTFTGDQTNFLRFDAPANAARTVNVEQGNHVFTVPINLHLRAFAGTGTFGEMAFNVVRAQDVLSIQSDITYTSDQNAATLTVFKQGPGRLDITNLETDDVVARPLRINVQGGTMRFIPGSGRTHVNGVTIAGGATPTAQLDITDNPLVLNYDPVNGSPLNTVKAQIASGFAGGAWNGNGIISSNGNSNQFGVGYAEASNLPSVPAIFGTVDADSLLVRLTRYGDADLNGLVNLSDFNRLAANFGLASDAVWSQGDFDYNGNVNLADFNRLAANFGLQASPDGPTPDDWATLAAAIPEPSSLALAGIGAVAVMRRRRGH